MDYDSCAGTGPQIEPSGSLRGPNKGEKNTGEKIITTPASFLFSWTRAGCVFHASLLFILISILLLCSSSPLTSVKMHRKLFPQWDFFTHLLLIRELNAHWRRTPPGSWLYFTTHKQTLSQIRLLIALAVIGPRRACAVQLWNAYTEGLPSRFWWMDGHQAIGLCSGSDVWSAWYWGGWREAGELFRI